MKKIPEDNESPQMSYLAAMVFAAAGFLSGIVIERRIVHDEIQAIMASADPISIQDADLRKQIDICKQNRLNIEIHRKSMSRLNKSDLHKIKALLETYQINCNKALLMISGRSVPNDFILRMEVNYILDLIQDTKLDINSELVKEKKEK